MQIQQWQFKKGKNIYIRIPHLVLTILKIKVFYLFYLKRNILTLAQLCLTPRQQTGLWNTN